MLRIIIAAAIAALAVFVMSFLGIFAVDLYWIYIVAAIFAAVAVAILPPVNRIWVGGFGLVLIAAMKLVPTLMAGPLIFALVVLSAVLLGLALAPSERVQQPRASAGR